MRISLLAMAVLMLSTACAGTASQAEDALYEDAATEDASDTGAGDIVAIEEISPLDAADGGGSDILPMDAPSADTSVADIAPELDTVADGEDSGAEVDDPGPPLTCNGAEALCGRRFDEVAYVTAHNAMSNREEGWGAPNQEESIPAQLASGVRGLMLDTHEWPEAPYPEEPYLCHGFCLLGNELLVDGLAKIERFLRRNRGEVVTIIFENYVTAEAIAAAFEESDLLRYAYAHDRDTPWPTLREMIDRDERLVVFTDRHGGAYPWFMDVWQHAFETHWSAATLDDLSCHRNRGRAGNALFILNHFLTNPVALPTLAAQANDVEILLPRALECMEHHEQIPNFVTVDFTSIGDVFAVVDALNGL